MKITRVRFWDGLFVLWVIVVNALYYHQFWAQFAPRIHALLNHLWHS